MRPGAVALGLALVLLGGCGGSSHPTAQPVRRTSAASPIGTAPVRVLPAVPRRRAASPRPRGVTIAFTGDMLPSDPLLARAHQDAGGHGYDFRPMLRTVAPLIASADLAICHQETVVSGDDVGLQGWPSFVAPWELARAERQVGYDGCDTASNHTFDHGAAGVKSTLDTLDRFGLKHVGSARTPAEDGAPVIYTVHGVRVGHLAYTFGLNGDPAHPAWMVNLIDPARIGADAHRLRQAGAQIVIVSLHMGTEKDQTPNPYERATAAAVMRSPDVDLIVGCHAHVVQPIQRLADGRYVVYGLGNFLAQQDLQPGEGSTPPHRDGVIVEASFVPAGRGRYRVARMGYVPTFVDAPSDVVELAPAFSRARTVASLTALGAHLVDLTPRR